MHQTLYHTNTLDAALYYASIGWHIFPVWGSSNPAMAKHPNTDEVPHWSQGSTTDPEQIAAWFTGTGYGIGLDCGKSNVLVLDGDRLDEIPDVDLSNAWVLQGNTNRRSWLFDMPANKTFGNRTGGWTGGEVRGKGGYVVLPPSYHPEGFEQCYRWLSTSGSRKMPIEIQEMLEEYETKVLLDQRTALPKGLPCKRVLDKARQVIEQLDDGPRHESMVSGTMAIFRLGADGHSGAKHGLAMVRDSFYEAVAGDRTHPDPVDEFRRAVQNLPYQIAPADPQVRCTGETCGELEELEWTPPEAPESPQIEPDPQPLVTSKAKLKMSFGTYQGLRPRRTHWLWDGYVPLGELTLCGGRPGIGKSTVGYWLTAQATKGELEGERKGQPIEVLIMAAEDSVEQTILPRLLAHDADLSRVHHVELKRGDVDEPIRLDEHIAGLSALIKENNIGLVVLDPIMSFVGADNNTDKDHQVRAILDPLVKLAHQERIALFAIMHLNKGRGKDPLDRFMGSVGWGAVARSAVLIQVDPEDRTRRLLGQVKSNLGLEVDGQEMFEIETVVVGVDDNDGTDVTSSRINWLAHDYNRDTRETLARWESIEGKQTGQRSEKDRAIDLIKKHIGKRERLSHAEVVALKEEAKAVDISRETLANARRAMNIEPVYLKGHSPPQTEWVRTNWDALEEMFLDDEETE